MEKKLKLYRKTTKIRIGVFDGILYFLLALLAVFYGSDSFFYDDKNTTLDALGDFFCVTVFVYLVFYMIANFFRYEKIRGELTEDLIFEQDRIHFGKKMYPLNTIEKMLIESSDQRGDLVNFIKKMMPHRSNGCRNYVKLFLKDGIDVKYYFQQTEHRNTKVFQDEFIAYYNQRKLTWQNLLNLLKISKSDEIQVFKKKYYKE